MLSHVQDLYLRYIFDLEDPNKMSSKFRKAFSATLAQNMAIALTNSNTVEDQMEQRAEKLLSKAKSSDGIQSSPERRPVGSWLTSRGGGYRNNTSFDF